jgi:hypothetical protein
MLDNSIINTFIFRTKRSKSRMVKITFDIYSSFLFICIRDIALTTKYCNYFSVFSIWGINHDSQNFFCANYSS